MSAGGDDAPHESLVLRWGQVARRAEDPRGRGVSRLQGDKGPAGACRAGFEAAAHHAVYGVEGRDGRDGGEGRRFIQHFRKSKPIANDGTLLHVSGNDAGFAKSLVEEYEAGLRRIDKNGMRRRIFEYYGLPYEPIKEE